MAGRAASKSLGSASLMMTSPPVVGSRTYVWIRSMIKNGPARLLFRLMTYTSFTLGSLFVTSDRILLVGVHLVHHLFLLLLTLALLLSRDLPLAGSLFIRSRSFSSVSALAGGPIVSSPMVHMSSIGLYRTPGLLESKTILFLPLLTDTDGFELSLILLCLLLVLNFLLPVSLNGGSGVIVGIP
jgi:hypothetical protein